MPGLVKDYQQYDLLRWQKGSFKNKNNQKKKRNQAQGNNMNTLVRETSAAELLAYLTNKKLKTCVFIDKIVFNV